MRRTRVLVLFAIGALSATGRARSQRWSLAQGPNFLAVQLHVGNETAGRIGVRVQIDGRTALDTTLDRSTNVTGRVHTQTIWVAPGTHRIEVTNTVTHLTVPARLTAEPGPMYITAVFNRDATSVTAGRGVFGFL